MPPAEPTVPVEVLLEAARQRIATSTLRQVAAEVGMEHSGLNKLLKQDQRPRPSTVRKLTEWYLKLAAAGELAVQQDVGNAALAVLVRHLPVHRRESAIRQIVELLQTVTAREGVPAPDWLQGE